MADGEESTRGSDRSILGFCELLGLMFALPFGEDLYHGTPITNAHTFYLIIGLLFALAGPMWPTMRAKLLPPRFADKFSDAALDPRYWIFALLAGLICVVASDSYQRGTESFPVAVPHPLVLIPLAFIALCLAGWIGYQTGTLRKRPGAIAEKVTPKADAVRKPEINIASMSAYDRERRKQVIDELIASITAGKTLQSLKDAGALAHLLQSAIFPRHSIAEFRDELIKVRNSMVDAGNERLQIANRYPEHRDILNLIERKDQIAEAADSDPHDLGIWPPVHSYMTNPNIPDDAITPPKITTWIFFKDTRVIGELNAKLFGYCDWCEKVKAALVDKRDALG